jgi:putative transcriptional regulator
MLQRALCLAILAGILLRGASPALPAAGRFLVASTDSRDPDFAATVILVLRSDANGAVGLIVNQPTKVTVADLFPRLDPKQAGTIPIYKGGPVRLGINALLRRKAPSPGASGVFSEVELIAQRPLLEKAIADGTPAATLRVYVGSCGWTAGQLLDEIRRGVWSVTSASAAVIFDGRPETLWSRLNSKR